jgi:hypothetical protein
MFLHVADIVCFTVSIKMEVVNYCHISVFQAC